MRPLTIHLASGLINQLRRSHRTRKTFLSARRLTQRLDQVPIDRPIFFLGVQGGGLTILHKCFQRLPNTCFAHGNHLSWDAADNEMHAYITDKRLPKELYFHTNEHQLASLATDFYRYWTFATNRAIEHYRHQQVENFDKVAKNFRQVLKSIIRAHAIDPQNCRFLDKSQLYTINAALINEILKEESPHFVVVARNPYGSVPRTAKNYYLNPKKHNFHMGYEEALTLCAEHWNNSFRHALDDCEKIRLSQVMRIEDFFQSPENFCKKVCQSSSLKYSPDMLPAPDQEKTIYQQMARRWYPIKPSSTEKAKNSISDSEKNIIDRICG